MYGRLNEPEDVQSFYNFYNQSKKEKEDDPSELKPFERDPYKKSYMETLN